MELDRARYRPGVLVYMSEGVDAVGDRREFAIGAP